MHAELRTQGGTIGAVTLVDGSARATDEATKGFLDTLVVVEPGSLVRLGLGAGERYLRALPATLRGSYLWAVLIDPA